MVNAHGQGGSDTIIALYTYSIEVYGDDGDDRLFMSGAPLNLHGGDGNDWLWATGNYPGKVYGEAGNDTICSSPDRYLDTIDGGADYDRTCGGAIHILNVEEPNCTVCFY